MVKFPMAKQKSHKPKGPIQILAAIGLVIAILWTAKALFQVGGNTASLLSFKKYAKCKYESQKGVILQSTRKFYGYKYVEYFAFDKENFYYKYNIREKNFDWDAKIVGKDSSLLWSGFHHKPEVQLVFDSATGTLEIKTRKQNGSIYFLCSKISRSKLPKSVF